MSQIKEQLTKENISSDFKYRIEQLMAFSIASMNRFNMNSHHSSYQWFLSSRHNKWAPPESILNSEVKQLSIDDSARFPM